MNKPNFPESGIFSYQSLSNFTLKKILKLERDEKKSRGSFSWYFFPCNVSKLFEYIKWEKNNIKPEK